GSGSTTFIGSPSSGGGGGLNWGSLTAGGAGAEATACGTVLVGKIRMRSYCAAFGTAVGRGAAMYPAIERSSTSSASPSVTSVSSRVIGSPVMSSPLMIRACPTLAHSARISRTVAWVALIDTLPSRMVRLTSAWAGAAAASAAATTRARMEQLRIIHPVSQERISNKLEILSKRKGARSAPHWRHPD